MDAPMIISALAVLALLITVTWRVVRARSDERLQWQATRQRDWSTEELAELRATDAAA